MDKLCKCGHTKDPNGLCDGSHKNQYNISDLTFPYI